MSEFWNRRVREIAPYVPGEQPRGKKFIKLNTNENPYPPSPAAIEALSRFSNADEAARLRLYPDPACTELREAVAKVHAVRLENVFAGNGSDEILAFAFGAFFEADSPVLTPDITYSFYPVYAKLWDVPLKLIPLNAKWEIEAGDYLQNSGGVVFPNPNAPTGCALRANEINEIARYNSGRVVITDEAYGAFGAENPDAAGEANILHVYTFSKAYSLAGLRVGYAIGGAELITALERMRDSFNSYTVDMIAQKTAAAAILDKDYFELTRNKIIATRERIAAVLRNRGYELSASKANFLFCRHPSMGGAEFLEYLRGKGILVRHFSHERIKDFVRVSVGTDAETDALLECL